MKAKMVFCDWQKWDKEKKNIVSVYNDEEGLELSSGDFHSGTTFEVSIALDSWQEKEAKEAIKKGYRPCFYMVEA